jgi:hypothetical protein
MERRSQSAGQEGIMRREGLKQYKRKAHTEVVAVQLDLDTQGFTYVKWGGTQTCKAGDWLVNNQGDTYTVDQGVFERTYQQVRPGLFAKTSQVWARRAEGDGEIQTKEGVTQYHAGDYVVYNDPGEGDGYAIQADKFEELYEREEEGN